MSLKDHRQQASKHVQCAIITVSDTRTAETDTSGQLIRSLLEEHGHSVTGYTIIKDEYQLIQCLIKELALRNDVQTILLNGGTGIALRDTTYEAVRDCLDKEMPGFGELFRYLSFVEDIGSAAILSRAAAGVIGDTAVFSMPGSKGAVRLAMTKLILPEIGHVMQEIYKDRK
jgi:molybdopterin adenylyltransferase